MRRRYVWDRAARKWVLPRRRPAVARGPMIVTDSAPAFQSMVDGRTYESKSEYRRANREESARTGVELIEVGNDRSAPPKQFDPPSNEEALAKAWERAEQMDQGEYDAEVRRLEAAELPEVD